MKAKSKLLLCSLLMTGAIVFFILFFEDQKAIPLFVASIGCTVVGSAVLGVIIGETQDAQRPVEILKEGEEVEIIREVENVRKNDEILYVIKRKNGVHLLLYNPPFPKNLAGVSEECYKSAVLTKGKLMLLLPSVIEKG